MLDLSGCATRREVLTRVAERAGTMHDAGAEQWLLGIGLRVHTWSDDPRWPTRQELDLISSTHPVCLMSFDHHSVVASTGALAAAGIGLRDPDPTDGVICRDLAGDATGVLLESAAMRAWNRSNLSNWSSTVRPAMPSSIIMSTARSPRMVPKPFSKGTFSARSSNTARLT
jgi:predicted amidohydrolase YtcJ